MDRLDEILVLLRKQTLYEAKQNGSEFIESDKWPKGLVVVRDNIGQAKGMGFLAIFGGKLHLVTAAHVAILCKRGMILSAGIDTLQKHVELLAGAEIGLHSTTDIVAIVVPANTASKLGVSKVKLGKTPSQGKAITTFGYVKGKFVSSLGVMGKPAAFMGFEHGCSTLCGFSGTPIYKDEVIVGIHSRSDGLQTNFGLSLDFLVESLESSDYDSARHMRELDEFEELENKTATWQWGQQSPRRGYSTDKSFAVDTEHFRSWNAATLGTFDWMDETPMNFEDVPRFAKLESVFRNGPNLGANNTSSGTQAQTNSTQTTSADVVVSTSSTPEAKETPVSRRRRNRKKSKRSKAGNGLEEESKLSSTVLETTAGVSGSENGNQAQTEKNGSEPKSWTQAYTQELLNRIGGLGRVATFYELEEMVKRSREAASQRFPRLPQTSSTPSKSSLRLTL